MAQKSVLFLYDSEFIFLFIIVGLGGITLFNSPINIILHDIYFAVFYNVNLRRYYLKRLKIAKRLVIIELIKM